MQPNTSQWPPKSPPRRPRYVPPGLTIKDLIQDHTSGENKWAYINARDLTTEFLPTAYITWGPKFQGATQQAPALPPKYTLDRDAEEASWEDKWKARVESYWSTHPYRCQSCDKDGGQRHNDVLKGEVQVRGLIPFAERKSYPGTEKNEDLAALCWGCWNEARYISNQTGDPLADVVHRFTFRNQATTTRRQRLIAKQRRHREYIRARRAQWKAELEEHQKRWREVGITIPREFHSKYRDLPMLPARRYNEPDPDHFENPGCRG